MQGRIGLRQKCRLLAGDLGGNFPLNFPFQIAGRLRFAPAPAHILKLELSWKTALMIANAMKPTKANTAKSTTVAMMLVKAFNCAVIAFW